MNDDPRVEEAVCAAIARPYARVLTREAEGGYSAEVVELPGCFSTGESAVDAMERLDEAIALWVEAALAEGQDIPPPSREAGYSGRFTLRLLPSIHERAALLARREGVSLNRYFAAAISYYVGLDSGREPAPAEAGQRAAVGGGARVPA